MKGLVFLPMPIAVIIEMTRDIESSHKATEINNVTSVSYTALFYGSFMEETQIYCHCRLKAHSHWEVFPGGKCANHEINYCIYSSESRVQHCGIPAHF